MSEPTLKLLGSADFNPDKYVRELSQNCIGGPELIRLRNKVHSLSEENSGSLKRNVYQNYMQFIDTAREISHLESEMYQLSHLLSEQRSLLNLLSNTSILGDETPVVVEVENKESEEQIEEARRQKMASILEKVEGCSVHLEVPGRNLLHEGDLLELDSSDETNPLKRIHGYLFTDGVMIAAWNANRRGPMRYKLEAFYDLGSLAVVNVRDLGNVKYAFKLLAFPDTRVFQSTSNAAKKEWLEKFDQAKRIRLTRDQIRRESVAERSPSRVASIDSPSLPFVHEIEEEINVHPDWLLEIPEELDVCVAQRHFEDALNMLLKAKEYFVLYKPQTDRQDHTLNEIKRKVDQRHATLTEVLMKELEVNPDKSLQGGLRAARRAVRLSNRLGKQAQSCDLFLRLCSSMMRTQCKRVKREGSTSVYIRNLSSVVFTNMSHMTEEFLRAFPDSPSCASAYVVWASSEINQFTTHFIKQVFISQTSLTTLTECVMLAQTQCERLCTYGIDMRYQLDGGFRSPLCRAICDARDKLIDAVKLRALEDKWQPTNFRSKAGLARRLQEYLDMGIDLETYVSGDVWLQLTSNTLAFTKSVLNYLDDCLKLQNPELLHTIDESLLDIFEAQIKHVEDNLRGENLADRRLFIIKNGEFILNVLARLVQQKYENVVTFQCKTLDKVRLAHTALLQGVSPTQRNVPKYSSNEYL